MGRHYEQDRGPDNGGGHDEARPFVRRRKTFHDWVEITGGLIAILATVGGLAGWAFNLLPVVKAAEFASKMETVDKRFSSLEQATGQIIRAENRSTRLQLLNRRDLLEDKLKTLKPGDPLATTLHEELNQTMSDLIDLQNGTVQ